MPSTEPESVRQDFWREDFRSYAAQWGYDPESQVAKLIDFARDEYRTKYGSDYRLSEEPEGYSITDGERSDGSPSRYGEEFLIENAPRFGVSIIPKPTPPKL